MVFVPQTCPVQLTCRISEDSISLFKPLETIPCLGTKCGAVVGAHMRSCQGICKITRICAHSSSTGPSEVFQQVMKSRAQYVKDMPYLEDL